MDKMKNYDVVISYASEQSKYAQGMKVALNALGFSVFVYEDEPERFWGKYLSEELLNVYTNEGKLMLILLSKEYINKKFTKFEGRIASDKILEESTVLIIKMDDVSVPGIIKSLGYEDVSKRSIQGFAEIIEKILKKKTLLSSEEQKSRPPLSLDSVYRYLKDNLINFINKSIDSRLDADFHEEHSLWEVKFSHNGILKYFLQFRIGISDKKIDEIIINDSVFLSLDRNNSYTGIIKYQKDKVLLKIINFGFINNRELCFEIPKESLLDIFIYKITKNVSI